MWRLLAKLTVAVFAAAIVLLAFAMHWRTGRIDWLPLLIIAMIVSTLFAARAFFVLRAERLRWLAEHERERIRALGRAVGELIDAMARLSPADLSVYQSVLQVTDPADTACILTAQGSPNHLVLVQMTDLRLAVPEEFQTLGEPPHQFTSVRYALTPFGRSYIPKLLTDVLRQRATLAAGNSPAA